MQKKVADVRRENLKRLVTEHGGPTNLAKALGYKNHAYVYQMLSSKRPVGEKTARVIEDRLKLPAGSLDKEAGKVALFEGTSHPLIADSIRALGDALEEAKLEIPSAKFAKLVAEIYERAATLGRVDADYVRRLVALLK